jgi:hypothetical protein
MQNIDVVIGECNTILFAFFLCIGEKDYRTRMTGSTGSAGFLKVERFFEVERWKGEMVIRFPRNKSTKLYSVSSRAATRDPVFLKTTSQP